MRNTSQPKFCKNPFLGIFLDLQKRIPKYFSDFKDAFHPKILSASLLMYFASICPALTFGEFLVSKTEKSFGVTEVLMSTAICGSIYAFFSGQPIVIVGVTGPVSIFSLTIYSISQSFEINFLQWMFWISVWASFMHILLAILNGTNFVSYVSRYSCEVFGILIAIIYIVTGIQDLVGFFGTEPLDSALLSLLIGLATFYLSMSLHHANSWIYFHKIIRLILADYGASCTLIIITALSYAGKFGDVKLNRLDRNLPGSFGTTSGRDWLIYPLDNDFPTWAIFAAILPGFVLTVLFFFDHNVSSLLSQKKEFKLKKGSAFHWDFLIIGLMILLCGILGIPPTNGLIPQAPLHVRALAEIKEIDAIGYKKTEYLRVHEQRVSGFLQSLVIGLTLLFLDTIGMIPVAVLSGFFLYMGFATFEGNQFSDRFKLFFTDKNLMPPYRYLKKIPFLVITKFTLIQLIALGIIYGITWSPAAISFPVFILLLVPLRSVLLPKIFSEEELELLDSEKDPIEHNLGNSQTNQEDSRIRRGGQRKDEIGEEMDIYPREEDVENNDNNDNNDNENNENNFHTENQNENHEIRNINEKNKKNLGRI